MRNLIIREHRGRSFEVDGLDTNYISYRICPRIGILAKELGDSATVFPSAVTTGVLNRGRKSITEVFQAKIQCPPPKDDHHRIYVTVQSGQISLFVYISYM
jgi:hypothetical protein